MSSVTRRRLAAGLLLCLLPLAASAKKLHVAPVQELLPQLPAADKYAETGRSTQLGDTTLALYGLAAAVLPGTPEQMAREFLRGQALRLNLRQADLSDLNMIWTRESRSGINVHFQQMLSGIPVYDARMVVHISPNSLVTQLASGYRPKARLASTQPLISASQARDAALARLGAQAPLRADLTELTAYAMGDDTRLAWRVRVSPAHPIGDWDSLVDAATGEVLVQFDRSAYADAPKQPRGSIFDPDPLSSSRSAYGAPMQDNDDADDAAINAQIRIAELGDLAYEGGVYTLKSQWAEITDHETPSNGLFQQSSPDFIFTREPDAFEAVMTFWHIQDSMTYINDTLGIPLRPYQYAGGVQFDPQGLDGEDNSHYDSSTGQLAFGEGCVDDDEDADVIRHELGHGLHDWVTNGGLSNMVDGLSEGFGDYWAMSYSRAQNQWQPSDEAYNWVYSWDGHNECWAGRVTNYNLRWPLGLKPYPLIHDSGQMISTCLMKVYDQIGREKTDTIALEGLAMTSTLSSQNDAANGMVQAAQDLGLPEADAIRSTFSGCGYIIAPGLGLSPVNPVKSASLTGGKFGGALNFALLLPLLGLGLLRSRKLR